jgi:flagellar protein FliS
MQDIIVELSNSLDFEVGGDVAKELASLYDYILYSSTQANIKIEKNHLEGCLRVLNTLYDGWTEAIKQIKTQNTKSA